MTDQTPPDTRLDVDAETILDRFNRRDDLNADETALHDLAGRLYAEVDRERREHEQTRQAAAKAVADCVRLEAERDAARAAGWDEGYGAGRDDEADALPESANPYRGASAEPPELAAIRDRVKRDLVIPPGLCSDDGLGRDLMQARRDRATLLANFDAELNEWTRPTEHLRERLVTADAAENAEADARPGPGRHPMNLDQVARALHQWARDLTTGTRRDWPYGEGKAIVRGIDMAADWLDARARYEAEAREQQAAPAATALAQFAYQMEQNLAAFDDAFAKAYAKAAEPTWRDVIRAMWHQNIRLHPVGDTSEAADHRTWQLVDRHDDEIGRITHEVEYWGEEWTVAFNDECGPSTRIAAEALEPAAVLNLARLAGLIGDTDA